MLSAVIRIMLLVLCLGASSFASASSHVNILYLTQTSPVYTTVIEAPKLNITTITIDGVSHIDNMALYQYNLNQALTKKHPTEPTDRYTNYNNGLPTSFYNTKLALNFPSPTNIKFPLWSGKHHRLDVSNLNNIINTSNQSLKSLKYSTDEIVPIFELVFEFPIPPIPMLAIGYAEPLSPQSDWILNIKSTSSRISGWKESNLLYSHNEHPFVTA